MTTDELWNRLWATQQLPRGKAQITALETVLREADRLDSAELRYAARIFITSAYQMGGEPAKAFVPFSWCLAVYDRGEADPRWNENLYWFFKFMVSSMTGFPEIPLDRTYAVLDDMERRYRVAGHTVNPVHQYRARVARHVGDRETAAEQYRLWAASPRGDMSDCIGCEPSDKVGHLSWLGRYEDAIDVATPVLGGEFSCVEQPQDILTSLLLPYVHTGRLEEAAKAHRQAYRAIQHDPAQLREISVHIEFCALTGNHARGLDLVERHLGWLDDAPTPLAELDFAAAAALTLRLVTESGHGDAQVRRPGGEVPAVKLREELTERALAIADRFDARNGSSEQGDVLRATLAAEPLVEHLPLSGPVLVVPVAEPSTVDLPASPVELADLAEERGRLGGSDGEVWARFDEICPAPEGELLARRLTAAADNVGNRDPEAAARDWSRAAELFTEAGNPLLAEVALSKRTLLRTITGELDGSELAASADRIAAHGVPRYHAGALLRQVYYLLATNDFAAGAEVLARAEEPVRASGSAVLLAQWLSLNADVLGAQEELPRALEFAEAAATQYAEAGAANRVAWMRLQTARLHAALDDLERAHAVVTSVRGCTDGGARAQLRHFEGQLAADLGRPEDAAAAFRAAVAEFEAAGQPVEAAVVRVDLALACLNLDLPEEAADAAEDAEPVLAKVHAEHQLATARFLLGKAYRALGRRELALPLFAPVVEHFVAAEHPAGAGEASENAAETLDALDRDAEAAAEFARAAEFYRAAELTAEELRTRRRTALSWHWSGNAEAALAAVAEAEAVAVATVSDDPHVSWERAMVGYDSARVLANLGRPEEALSRATPSAEFLRALGASAQAAVADVLRGRILRDLGRVAEARAILTAALAELPESAARQRSDVEALLADLTE